MTTTQPNAETLFIRTYPMHSSARHFAARLLSATRGGREQTEAHIACVAEMCGVSVETREEVIGAAIDAGLVRATMLTTAQSGEFGAVAALTSAATKKYAVGDSVVCNGYPGTVSAVTDNGMIEVKLASGGVCVDPCDELTVQPGAVWAALCKMAESDLRRARKEGSILICETRLGTVELAYYKNAKRFEAHTMGLDSRFVASGTTKEMVERVASLYQIVVAS